MRRDDRAPAERTTWASSLGAPVRAFLRTETSGATVLVGAALIALLWANSPWPDSYERFWTTDVALSFGEHALRNDVRGWVNQGLMTIFFLVVGLEAKRELDQGELRERARLTIPALAAVGGMTTAVAIYLAINWNGPGASGWGAAMSTDTALALGALAIVTPRRAVRVRVFLLTLVVVDDLVALLVIALVYSTGVSVVALGVAVLLFGVLSGLRYLRRGRAIAAVVVGIGIWLAMYRSGVDPVIAGLVIGLVTSSYPPARGDLERATQLARSFREQPSPELAHTAQQSLVSAISPNERLQFLLHPWTTYGIVPLFALANAGIPISGAILRDAVHSPITIGIVLAFVVGKPAGILVAAWLGSRRILGGVRPVITWPILAGAGAAAGTGFTVSLLIANLAFDDMLLNEAKLGILAAAVLSPGVAWLVFRGTRMLPTHVRNRQLSRVAEPLVDLDDEIDPTRDHIRGDPDASVTLLEYADFECPFCGRAEPAVRALLDAESGPGLRYVFRHLPLTDVHPHAEVAAEAAEAAGAQGAFWPMHDLLFEHQDALTARDTVRYAERLGLDVERFRSDLRARRFLSRIGRDVAGADASGVSGTPTFFVNGRRHHGSFDTAALTAAIQLARRHAAIREPD